MSINFKSNVAYAGAGTLSNVSVVTKSATDLYNEYAAAVTSDGGTIVNPTECQAVFTQLVANGNYWRLAAAIGTQWGVKMAGADYAKFYSLRGSVHGICAGTVNKNTAVVPGENLAEFQAGDTITFTGLNVLAAGADGLGVMGVVQGAATSLQTAFTPAAEQWLFNIGPGAGNTLLTVNAVTKFTVGPEYVGANLDAHGMMAEMSLQRTSGYQNGLLKKVTTPSGGFTSLVPGVTANVVLQRVAGTPYLAEWFFFNDISGLVGQNAMINNTLNADGRY